MGAESNIEWTDATFNPWRGCTKVSPGCTHCYAETLSHRNPGTLGIWGDKGTRVVAAESYWRQPIKWDREAKAAGVRRRVFCASLADVFEDREELVEPRVRLWKTILYDTPHLDWLLLTKRPENIIPALKQMWAYQKSRLLDDGCLTDWIEGRHVPPNVWLGTSVEDQARADQRVPRLLAVPAAVHFLSMEPLLGPVNISPWLYGEAFGSTAGRRGGPGGQTVTGEPSPVSWVIVGGESGPKARPMHPAWARAIRDDCRAAGVPFLFKQWGEWAPDGQHMPHLMDVIGGRGSHAWGTLDREGEWFPETTPWNGRQDGDSETGEVVMRKVGKKSADRMIDGRTWDELPLAVEAN